MYAEERRQAIYERARRDGRVDVGVLAEGFSVTAETIRKDLTDLEQRGVLRRVHGGAIPLERLRIEPAVAERSALMAEEKRRIADAATAFVPQAGTILLDAGTTTGALAAVLPERPLTVVTNALPIAMTLAVRPALTIMLVGGRVRERTLANVDDWAVRTLAEVAVDVAFVATNGISVRRGLSTPDPAEAAVKRAMVAAGQRVILLADRTKVGAEHFVRFAELGAIDVAITDRDIDEAEAESIRRSGVEVVLA